jgi:hypothetical protein
VVYVAVLLLIRPVPRTVDPSLNVTVQVAPAVTVAVNITEPPYVDVGDDDITLVNVGVLLMLWVMTDDVDPAKFVSPP